MNKISADPAAGVMTHDDGRQFIIEQDTLPEGYEYTGEQLKSADTVYKEVRKISGSVKQAWVKESAEEKGVWPIEMTKEQIIAALERLENSLISDKTKAEEYSAVFYCWRIVFSMSEAEIKAKSGE